MSLIQFQGHSIFQENRCGLLAFRSFPFSGLKYLLLVSSLFWIHPFTAQILFVSLCSYPHMGSSCAFRIFPSFTKVTWLSPLWEAFPACFGSSPSGTDLVWPSSVILGMINIGFKDMIWNRRVGKMDFIIFVLSRKLSGN